MEFSIRTLSSLSANQSSSIPTGAPNGASTRSLRARACQSGCVVVLKARHLPKMDITGLSARAKVQPQTLQRRLAWTSPLPRAVDLVLAAPSTGLAPGDGAPVATFTSFRNKNAPPSGSSRRLTSPHRPVLVDGGQSETREAKRLETLRKRSPNDPCGHSQRALT
ncbi:hypothetical protein D9C73_016880 [Collichthys lucidus]|uniref:Uncharacterized protein n=1 Tax=Collichthys lucidus TaxID=240159 RepID=A0A4U5V630_COLLU|nr:hypothetical protein D9C73_016880 [Collichthys lucidus]